MRNVLNERNYQLSAYYQSARSVKFHLFFLVFLLSFVSLQAQRSAILNELGWNSVTTVQRDFTNKMVASGYYNGGKVVSTQSLLSNFGESSLKLYLPGSNQALLAEKVSFDALKSPYYDEMWMGKIEGDAAGNILFVKKDALLAGFIQTRNKFYSIIPTDNNKSFLLDHNVNAYESLGCGSHGMEEGLEALGVNACMLPASTCSAIIDVLVLVSPAATQFLQEIPGASNNPFIPIIYTLIGLESVNFALMNSGVPNKRFRFTIEGLDFEFTEDINIVDDVNNLESSQEARDLRDDHGGDLVVLLTDQNYFPIFGVVKEIGPNNNDAYAIVEIPFLLNPRWTFAHEVAHLLGARHQRPENFDGFTGDDTDVCSHGFLFNGGALGQKRTILAASGVSQVPQGTPIFEMVPGGRLLNFSNPTVVVDGGATGTNDDDNARTIANTGCAVAQFRPDPNFRLQLNLSRVEVCMQDLFSANVFIFEAAAANPGHPPYTVTWNVSSSNSTTVYIPVDVSYPQQMTVTVTVASSDGVVLTKSRTVNIVNCNEYLQGSGTSAFANPLESVGQVAVKSGDEPTEQSNAYVFPNPATDELTIFCQLADEGTNSIMLTDANGRVLIPNYRRIEDGWVLDVKKLPKGMYFIRVSRAENVTTYSFIKM